MLIWVNMMKNVKFNIIILGSALRYSIKIYFIQIFNRKNSNQVNHVYHVVLYQG